MLHPAITNVKDRSLYGGRKLANKRALFNIVLMFTSLSTKPVTKRGMMMVRYYCNSCHALFSILRSKAFLYTDLVDEFGVVIPFTVNMLYFISY